MPVTTYVWNPLTDNVVKEKDGAGQTTAAYTHEPGLYGKLISQRRGGQSYQYHYDGQGSTRQLTDESQTVTDEYTYTAFGETVAESGMTENPYRYGGRHGYYSSLEAVSVYVRARLYLPRIARWLSVDPIGYVDGVNAFTFSLNNPLRFSDPSGTQTTVSEFKWRGKVIVRVTTTKTIGVIGGYHGEQDLSEIIAKSGEDTKLDSAATGQSPYPASALLCEIKTKQHFKWLCTSWFSEWYEECERIRHIKYMIFVSHEGGHGTIQCIPKSVDIPYINLSLTSALGKPANDKAREEGDAACNLKSADAAAKTSSPSSLDPQSGPLYYWWLESTYEDPPCPS